MKISINQIYPKFILLGVLCLYPFISSGIITIILASYVLVWIFQHSFNSPFEILKIIIPLIIIIIVGFINAYGNKGYDVGKDFWYFTNPVLVLYSGYLFMADIKNLKTITRIFIIAAFIVSLIHLKNLFFESKNIFDSSYTEIRGISRGQFISILGIVLISVFSKNKINIFQKNLGYEKIALLVCSTSFFLSFSRTLWVSFLILSLILNKYFTLKNIRKFILLSMVILVSWYFLSSIFILEYNNPLVSFSKKFLTIFQEISIKNYFVKKEIYQKWRGYETFWAIQTFLKGTDAEYLFGRGFGTLVDLKLTVPLGDKNFRFIPILHNGYAYILVKTGIVGICIYLMFFIMIIKFGLRYRKSVEADIKISAKFIIGICAVILASTVVITGFYNKISLFPVIILLGNLLSYIHLKKKSIDIVII